MFVEQQSCQRKRHRYYGHLPDLFPEADHIDVLFFCVIPVHDDALSDEVACGDGRSLLITELQADGGRRMAAADYLRGHPVAVT